MGDISLLYRQGMKARLGESRFAQPNPCRLPCSFLEDCGEKFLSFIQTGIVTQRLTASLTPLQLPEHSRRLLAVNPAYLLCRTQCRLRSCSSTGSPSLPRFPPITQRMTKGCFFETLGFSGLPVILCWLKILQQNS